MRSKDGQASRVVIVALDAGTGVLRWQLTPPEPGSGPARVLGPLMVDGLLAFVAASVSTRSDIFAVDSGGHVVWSAAPGGFVSALAADPGHRILYTASLLRLTNGPGIQLLTGYAEADGSVRSAVMAQIPTLFSPIGSLGFSNGLVFGTQSNDHGEGGIGALALHPDSGALAWSGDGNVTALTPSAVVDFHLRGDPNTIARNPSTGAALWRASTVTGAEAVAGDLVYTLSFTGDIEVRRISDGSVVTTVPVLAADPFRALTPSSGRLYVVTNTRLNVLAPYVSRPVPTTAFAAGERTPLAAHSTRRGSAIPDTTATTPVARAGVDPRDLAGARPISERRYGTTLVTTV